MNLHLVHPPGSGVYRIGKAFDPFKFPDPPKPLSESDEPELGGSRWDDPNGYFSTIYCGTTALTSFAETMACYRANPELQNKINDYLSGPADDEYDLDITHGLVPKRYVISRSLGHATVDPKSRYVDADHIETHKAITPKLISLIDRYKLGEIDRSVIFSRDRRITQPIGHRFYELAQTLEYQDLFGIRYESRLSKEWECWAMWEPTPIMLGSVREEVITWDNEYLRLAAKKLGLVLPD